MNRAPQEAIKSRLARWGSSGDASMGALARQLLSMVLAYTRQETVDPLRRLGRYLLWGVIGAFLTAVGAVLVVLGAVRAVQAETGSHLHGNWSWVPYMAGILVAVIVAAVAASRIGKAPR